MRSKPKQPSDHSDHQNHPQGTDSLPRIIKKYPNRRLYDTEISQYITLEDVAAMVRNDLDFVVLDAKTGDDLTRAILAQIIVEQESQGQGIFPVKFLRQIIQHYGDQWQPFLPQYLEQSMESFVEGQKKIQALFQDQWGQQIKQWQEQWGNKIPQSQEGWADWFRESWNMYGSTARRSSTNQQSVSQTWPNPSAWWASLWEQNKTSGSSVPNPTAENPEEKAEKKAVHPAKSPTQFDQMNSQGHSVDHGSIEESIRSLRQTLDEINKKLNRGNKTKRQ